MKLKIKLLEMFHNLPKKYQDEYEQIKSIEKEKDEELKKMYEKFYKKCMKIYIEDWK